MKFEKAFSAERISPCDFLDLKLTPNLHKKMNVSWSEEQERSVYSSIPVSITFNDHVSS